MLSNMPNYLDGAVKSYEADTGRMVHYYTEHRGWVTDFIYW